MLPYTPKQVASLLVLFVAIITAIRFLVLGAFALWARSTDSKFKPGTDGNSD